MSCSHHSLVSSINTYLRWNCESSRPTTNNNSNNNEKRQRCKVT